ncbi:Nucleotide-binding universal stress protein, UspA family [Arenibacter nanhaiticus]|uniref:Nucleotide-binding universal stress protein, UspA family n=1 Tax=Arenibacter nanhaiticus TaxID=558155 RepID=A0A1M6E526_9FLAO|nr:universal stress protein [Arenibacter nanhaiticus]SHI80378.1 Nucleotide-binding universal stress protein, UspA family [Arenibacter nanhaiticus]
MKRILIPTDFSENSYKAIAYALQLLKSKSCTFHLLNTYTPAIYQAEYLLHSPAQIGLGDIYQTNSETQLKELKIKLTTEFKNPLHEFVTHTAFNVLVDAIDELVSNESIDLVVMGTQGATGAKEIFLGSNTVHLLKRAKYPVLAVPNNYEFRVPKKILFPTDYEINYNTALLKEVLYLADIHKAKIKVMHISQNYELSTEQQKNKSKLTELLSGVVHQFHDLPDQGIIEGINSFQQTHETDVLVMVKNKHSFLENLFLKPVINQIGFHTNIPFLVLPYNLLQEAK